MTEQQRYCMRCAKPAVRGDSETEEIWRCPTQHGIVYRAALPQAPPETESADTDTPMHGDTSHDEESEDHEEEEKEDAEPEARARAPAAHRGPPARKKPVKAAKKK